MLEKAIIFAANAHEGQFRKGTKLPYIVHPMEVATIVTTLTKDIEVICAAVLHDVLEDCKQVTYQQLENEFGSKVASLVAHESEDKSKTWQERKQHTIDRLKAEKNLDIKRIALGDKLSNIRSLKRDYAEVGEELWLRFNEKDKRKQGWYYKGMIPGFAEFADHEAYQEYKRLVEDVFCDVI